MIGFERHSLHRLSCGLAPDIWLAAKRQLAATEVPFAMRGYLVDEHYMGVSGTQSSGRKGRRYGIYDRALKLGTKPSSVSGSSPEHSN
jgi:hypothetical protein